MHANIIIRLISASFAPLIRSRPRRFINLLTYLLTSLNKSQLSFLDFVLNAFCMKLFKTSDMQTVEFYRVHFNFELPSNVHVRSYTTFLDNATDLVKYFCVYYYLKKCKD